MNAKSYIISLAVTIILSSTLSGQPFSLLKDINQGSLSGNPSNFIKFKGKLYFTADDGVHGNELWKTDGTVDHTQMLLDINPAGSSSPSQFIELGGVLYFFADDGAHGKELWSSNGTADGTQMIKDINSGGGINPVSFFVLNNFLLFFADDGVHGKELWRSNGTESGTFLVKDIQPGEAGGASTLSYAVVAGRYLIFNADDGIHGNEIWSSDGTTAGTSLLKDIDQGGFETDIRYLTLLGRIVLFAANDGEHGMELWKSDGTAGGTALVKDIYPGTKGSFDDALITPFEMVAVNGAVYFADYEPVNGLRLWKSDGTENGTTVVDATKASFPLHLRKQKNSLIYTAIDPEHGRELWKTDGTSQGTYLVKDINPGTTGTFLGIQVPFLVSNTGLLYFVTYTPGTGSELWRSDGTGSGTFLVKDILPGTEGQFPLGLGLQDVDRITFILDANDGTHGKELWKTDGSEGGTEFVQDFEPGPGDSHVGSITEYKGNLYAIVENSEFGREIWVSNQNETQVKSIDLKGNPSKPDVHLAWRTFNQKNVKAYELERSFDNIHFEFVSSIPAQQAESGDYQYNDAGIMNTGYSVIYYRLKMIVSAVQFEYSESISVPVGMADGFNIWPNPVTDRLNILIGNVQSDKVKFRIIGSDGKTQSTYERKSDKGNLYFNWDISRLKRGMYYLIINDGNNISKKPFIKN